MANKPSSLQAVLERQKAQETPRPPPQAHAPQPKRKPSREATTLIGGHFSPDVARQLAIIAAEEGSTKQALLTEALDLLFVKKGKSKISDL